MGARGPTAKPLELKLLEGNRGRRPIDLATTFRPEVAEPPMPRDLSREGKKAWKRLVPELVQYNLVSKIDADALEELCETIALLKVLRRSINAKQELLLSEDDDPALAVEASTPNGMRIQSPTYQAMNREREKLRTWLAEFGLTPAQRARVTIATRTKMTLTNVRVPLIFLTASMKLLAHVQTARAAGAPFDDLAEWITKMEAATV